ncbi:MAG: MoaD/ThiS family protein, partial [Candidatus Promineifilaceae bacterium]
HLPGHPAALRRGLAARGGVRISVKLHGLLRAQRPAAAAGAPHHPFVVELPAGARLADLIRALGAPEGQVSAAAVNGQHAADDAALSDGDQVSLFPPAAGG